jgi:MFS family permease
MASTPETPAADRTSVAGGTLLTLAAGQFLMALDSSVMNVSIATVATDLDTTVSGIQVAITLYMLVMAMLMLTGGKVGQILGRKRAFTLGCAVYGAGSLTTALAPDLRVLILGWSVLEGIGAALIMPAVVALVAANFPPADRPRAYGTVAAFGAVAVAVGPLLGGLATTYGSWRWVFAGEVLVVLVILWMSRRMADEPPERGVGLDAGGTVLSAAGLGLVVFGILRGGTWGFVNARPNAPEWLGLSASFWLVLAGGLVLRGFLAWERHRRNRSRSVLVDPALLRNEQLRGGLGAFFLQYAVQAGLFFAIPLFLSIALGLSAIGTGLRILPLSLALLATAMAVPRLFPEASPRAVVRLGFGSLLAGIVLLIAALEIGVGPEIVTWPMLLAGAGIGALASQLGSVTISAVRDEEVTEVGGVQNTVTFLGAAIGTALAGAVVMGALTTSFLTGIQDNPDVPQELSSRAEVELDAGLPFIPDEALRDALSDAGVSGPAAEAVVAENEVARLAGLRTGLSVLALGTVLALCLTGGLPQRQPGDPGPPRRSGRALRRRSAVPR